jgi:hypothetical protein
MPVAQREGTPHHPFVLQRILVHPSKVFCFHCYVNQILNPPFKFPQGTFRLSGFWMIPLAKLAKLLKHRSYSSTQISHQRITHTLRLLNGTPIHPN